MHSRQARVPRWRGACVCGLLCRRWPPYALLGHSMGGWVAYEAAQARAARNARGRPLKRLSPCRPQSCLAKHNPAVRPAPVPPLPGLWSLPRRRCTGAARHRPPTCSYRASGGPACCDAPSAHAAASPATAQPACTWPLEVRNPDRGQVSALVLPRGSARVVTLSCPPAARRTWPLTTRTPRACTSSASHPPSGTPLCADTARSTACWCAWRWRRRCRPSRRPFVCRKAPRAAQKSATPVLPAALATHSVQTAAPPRGPQSQPGVQRLVMPVLRADFALTETYQASGREPHAPRMPPAQPVSLLQPLHSLACLLSLHTAAQLGLPAASSHCAGPRSLVVPPRSRHRATCRCGCQQQCWQATRTRAAGPSRSQGGRGAPAGQGTRAAAQPHATRARAVRSSSLDRRARAPHPLRCMRGRRSCRGPRALGPASCGWRGAGTTWWRLRRRTGRREGRKRLMGRERRLVWERLMGQRSRAWAPARRACRGCWALWWRRWRAWREACLV
jgi:hypothetical protein